MKLTKLPFLEKKKESSEYYLALILRNEKVISVIFQKTGNSIKYISHSEEDFENTIEDATSEHFLNTLDKVITSAETALPDNIETHKTLFGLKENWIEDNKIKKEYLEKLKKASDELVLEPIGFVVFNESIINLVQKDEGAPITAVLADIGKKYITVSLIKAGKILETRASEIHQSPTYTVDTLLKHFTSPETLPARVILFDSDEEELTQEFIGHPWSKSLAFLHLPQIMSLPKDAGIKAILLGAATQMGTELIYDASSVDADAIPQKYKPDETDQLQPIEKPDLKTKPEPETETEPTIPATQTPDYVDNSMEFFGFVENEDIAKAPVPEIKKTQKKIPNEVISENIAEIPEEEKIKEEETTPTPVNAALVGGKIKDFIPKLGQMLRKIKLQKVLALFAKFGGTGNKKFLIIGGIILVVVLAVLYMYLFTTKATITINVSGKSDQKTASVTFSPNSSTDIGSGVIAAQFVTVSEDGSVTLPTTGTKNVGTPAKGTVTVFNNDSSSVTFAKGTKITSGNDLVFTFDNSVTIASSSGDIFSGTTPGTANVSITANDIGQQYNLPSGTKFSISGTSTAAAKNDSALSGGTQKSVKIFSSDDQQKLLTALPKQLEDKARNDIASKATDGKTILPTFLDESVDNPTYDKKLNDQADNVTLKGTAVFETASYNNSDMLSLANSVFGTSNEQISKDNFNVTAKNISSQKNKDVTADLTIKVNLLPKIDIPGLTKQLEGIDVQKAKNMISNMPQVTSVDVKIRPNFFFLPQSLPASPNRINIVVSSD